MQCSRYAWAMGIAALMGLASACGSPGPPIPPSLQLPNPVNDLWAVRKGDRVYLAWSIPTRTTDGQTIRHPGKTAICRRTDSAINDCGSAIGEIASTAGAGTAPQKTEFTDILPVELQHEFPLDEASYAVSVMNANGRSAGLSNQVHVPTAPTLQAPQHLSAQVQASGILLSWSALPLPPIVSGLQYVYRLYRREKGSSADTKIFDGALTGEDEFTDHSFEWEKGYVYRITVATLVSRENTPEMQVEGDDSPAVEVFAHDTFPPAVPAGLQAVASGPGQPAFVDLIWTPDSDIDLAGYDIYRREAGNEAIRINSTLVQTPAYRDPTAVPGHNYFYSVSAVDLRGNESARSAEANESVP